MSIPFLSDIILKKGNKIQFTTDAGANAGTIDTDSSGNLVFNNTAGDILLGDGSADVYIGDGTNNVDIIFEQSGAIKGDGSAVTLTLGGANTTLNLENPNINGSLSIGATTINNKLTFTTTNGFILFDYEPSGDTGEYTTEVPLIKVDLNGSESAILSRVSEYRAVVLGIDDTVWLRAGDTGGVIKSNVNLANEVVLMSAEGGFHAYGFPGNDTTWSNRNEFKFYSADTTAANNGLYIGDGGSTQFIDLSRNLKNIGTISSGAITSTDKLTINKSSTHTAQGTFSATNSHLDLYNNWTSNTDQKGSIITFTDNYYDGSNYHKTTRAGIKGGTDTTGNTANGYLEFYTDSSSANSPNLALRLDSSQTATFSNHIDLTDGKYLMWGGNAIVHHNGTQTYIGDNSSSSALTLTGGNATFAGTVYIPSKLEHTGDSDTFLNFSDDTITLSAGGASTTFAGNGNATFAGNVEPSVNGSKDLGGASKRWATLYANNINTSTSSTFSGDLVLDDHVDGSPNLYFYNQANNYARLQFSTSDELVLKIGTSPKLTISGTGATFAGNLSAKDTTISTGATVSLANQPSLPLNVSNGGAGVDGRVFINVKHDQINTASAVGAGLQMQAGAVTSGTASYFSSQIFLQSAGVGNHTIHSAPKGFKFYVDNHDTAAGSGTSYAALGDLALSINEDTSATFAGVLKGPDGSGSAPTYSFSGRTDTGMWAQAHSSNDRIMFNVDGTNRAYIDANGITTGGNSYASGFRNYSGVWAGTTGTANNGFYFLNTAGGNTTKAMELSSGGNATFAGNIGLGGATSPNRLLHIDNTSSAATASAYFYTNAQHTGSTTQAHVSIYSDHASSTGQTLFVRGDGTGDLLVLNKGGTNKLVVDDDGNATFAGKIHVGSGTPNGIIDIHAGSGNWRVNDYGAMYFRNSSNATHESYIHSRSDGSLSIGRVAESNWTGSGAGAYAADTYDHVKFDTSSNATFAGNVLIPSNLQHVNDENNEISFGTDTQDFRTNNASRLDISNSGVRFGGTGARITQVENNDSLGTSDTKLATQGNVKAYVDTSISDLVDSAPGTLNTLHELATALGDDAEFSTTVTTSLGNRVRIDTANQGLNATQKSNARTNISAQASGNYITGSGSLSAQDLTDIGNLSGTNTGDQTLPTASSLGAVTLTGAQTISGNKTFSVQPTFNADTLHNGHIYGRSVDGESSSLYRFGGLYLTWDSDSYGLNNHHSLRSTYGNSFTDSITLNSYNHIRFNIDSNNNNSTSYFEVGDGVTDSSTPIFRLDQSGDVTITGDVTANGAISGSNLSGTNTGDQTLPTDFVSAANGGTFADSINVHGNILLTGSATTTNQSRMIDFTGFDKEGTTDFSDRAFIRHTTGVGGHSGSVLQISSQNDAADGIAFTTNASAPLKWNSHEIWTAGNDGAGSGLDADTLDGQHASAFSTATGVANNADVTPSWVPSSDPSYLTSLSGAVLTTGNQTASGTKTFSGILEVSGVAKNVLSQSYVEIYIYGDDDKYYPVTVSGASSHYGYQKYHVSRRYNWTAPSTWNTSTHMGALTLTWEHSSDTAWGGNDKAWRVIQFDEVYSNVCNGMVLPVTEGMVVWLRGGGTGGARYRVSTPQGAGATVKIYDNKTSGASGSGTHVASTTFTAGNGTTYSAESYSSSNVDSRIKEYWPIRDKTDHYRGQHQIFAAIDEDNFASNSNTRVPTQQSTKAYVDAHTYSHNHAASDINSGTLANARISSSSITQHEGDIDHDALTNFVSNEHIDWTAENAGTIHSSNYVDNNTITGSGAANKLTFWTGANVVDHDNYLSWNNTNNRLGVNKTDPSHTLDVVSGNNAGSINTVRITHTRNDSNLATQAVKIDANFSGADTTTTDTVHSGLYIDLDSSMDGDAANEVRSYGVYADVRTSGYNDQLRAGYFYAESNNTTEKTAEVTGVYGNAVHDSSSTNGGVSHMYGARGNVSVTDYGDVDNAYGVHGLVTIANNRNANVDVLNALYGEIQIDEETALNYGNMYGCRVVIDNNEGSTPVTSNQYLFHGDYQGTQDSNSYGIYCEGSQNTLTGTLSSGAITSTGKISGTELEGTSLDINGAGDVSGILNIGQSVGINTTDPNTEADGLTVYGATAFVGFNTQAQYDATVSRWTRMISDGNSINFFVSNTTDGTAGAPILSLNYPTSGGMKMGVGLSDPQELLHVKRLNSTATVEIQGGLSTITAIDQVHGEINFGANDASATGGIAGSIKSVSETTNGAHNGLSFYTGQQSRTPYLQRAMQIRNTGAISFGSGATTYGSSGQVLKSNGDASPTWVSVASALGYTPMNSSTTTISSAQSQKLGYITVTQAVDLDTIETRSNNGHTAYGWGDHAAAGYSTATGVANNADVTPSWVPSSDPSYLTSSSTQSKYIRSDASDTVNGDTTWEDSHYIALGNDGDFRIYHDGTNNHIRNYKHGANSSLQSESSMGSLHTCVGWGGSNGYANLYYNGSQKLITTSTGVSVTGTVVASGNIGNLNTSSDIGQQMEYGDANVATLRCDANRWRVYMGGSGNSQETLTVAESGRVGIKDSSPDYTLDVNGNVSGISIYASHDIAAYSDKRVKKDIETIPNALDKVSKLRGVTFKRTDEGSSDKVHMGVIAQEVQEVVPEVVTARESDGHLSVAYANMVGLLIESVKDLKAEIEELKKCGKCDNCNCKNK